MKRALTLMLAVAFAVAAFGAPAAAKKEPIDYAWPNPYCNEVTVHVKHLTEEKLFKPFGGFRYHVVRWYTNQAEDSCCRYMDTGIIKWTEADMNDEDMVLSGRSVHIREDGIGRAGHVVVEDGGITKHAGTKFGLLDDAACDELTS